ncbi:transposase family protein [Microcoleus sp. OTE_8_concoct_300]|uniref:transposase family protein n=1 Tax=Microcoleus sp. OTE_8_concoct_300 TaxID=2964710 RepID=UPI00403F42DA
MTQLAIVEAFSDLIDTRCGTGSRHQQALCLAMFTVAVVAGNKGFLAIGDWLKAHKAELVKLFQPPKGRIPSYIVISNKYETLDCTISTNNFILSGRQVAYKADRISLIALKPC